MPETLWLSTCRSMPIVPCPRAIYGCSISPRRSDVCVHIDEPTALNTKHTHTLAARATTMRVFPYLHLFLNETFELTSRVLILKKKRGWGKNIYFSSKCLLKLSCRLVSRAYSVLCASMCEVALSFSFFFFFVFFFSFLFISALPALPTVLI